MTSLRGRQLCLNMWTLIIATRKSRNKCWERSVVFFSRFSAALMGWDAPALCSPLAPARSRGPPGAPHLHADQCSTWPPGGDSVSEAKLMLLCAIDNSDEGYTHTVTHTHTPLHTHTLLYTHRYTHTHRWSSATRLELIWCLRFTVRQPCEELIH